MKNLQNSVLTVTMAIGLAITGLTPAHASTPTTVTTQLDQESSTTSITAAAVPITFEHPAVVTTPAAAAVPLVHATADVVQPQTSESVPPVAKAVAAPAPTPAAAPKPAAPAVAAPAPSAPASTLVSGNAVVAAALGQIGREQDCTMLVTNSLAAVGIHFHGWPADYMSLGHVVPASAAQPGDLAYYANGGGGMAHIAVYIGGGMAVHGGWEGHTTKVFSVNVGSGPVFIHIG